MRTVTIYAMFDPREPDRVRYVGKTEKSLTERLGQHLRESRSGIQSHRHKWIRSLLRANRRPGIRAIEVCREAAWQERERYWIERFQEGGHLLTNGSSGGDGLDSQSWKSIWGRPGARERQSEALSKYLATDAGRLQRSASSKKQWADPDARELQSKRMKEALASLDMSARAIHTKKSWQDPGVRARRIAGIRNSISRGRRPHPPVTDAYRAVRSQVMKLRWADPAYRERVSQSCRAANLKKSAHSKEMVK